MGLTATSYFYFGTIHHEREERDQRYPRKTSLHWWFQASIPQMINHNCWPRAGSGFLRQGAQGCYHGQDLRDREQLHKDLQNQFFIQSTTCKWQHKQKQGVDFESPSLISTDTVFSRSAPDSSNNAIPILEQWWNGANSSLKKNVPTFILVCHTFLLNHWNISVVMKI